MWTSLIKNIISYYRANNSKVYGCMLDASKAYDRIHFGKLFDILLQKQVPGVFIRLLLDSYQRQSIRTEWHGHFSESFRVFNGVKQGSIMSTILFNLYLDVLLNRIKKSGVGCHIGRHFLGCFAYADDVTILSTSVNGLQQMLNICKSFGEEYFMQFNEIKTVCICFDYESGNLDIPVYLGSSKLNWCDKVKHLGNYISRSLSDIEDVKYKVSTFIGSVNKLMAKFGDLQSHIF